VVAKAVMRRMRETGAEHVWLDARAFGEEKWQRRFPTILATCRGHGVDPVTDLIPVAPACHYASGGVATDLWGRSSVRGLYATGEVACSGVHGANRLASNSLLEGLVFSRRIAQVLPDELRPYADPEVDRRRAGVVDAEVRTAMQATMTERVGVLRNADGLGLATKALEDLAATPGLEGTAAWETTNLVSISAALAAAATLREETRGSHWREDFPERDDGGFAGHFDVRLVDGAPVASFVPAPATDGVTS
jgi:L-aspartate oxidase